MVIRLFSGFRHDVYGHIFAAELAFVEFHFAIDERKKGVVFAHTDIATRMGLGSALANNNVASYYSFATEFFNA